MTKRPFILDSGATFITSAIGYLFGITTSILLARTVGPEGKGILAVIGLAVGQVAEFLSLGLATAIVHYVGSSKADRRVVSSTTFLLSLLLGIAASIIAIVTLRFLLKPASSLMWLFIYVYALLSPLSLYSGYLSAIARAEGKIIEISGIKLAERIIHLLGMIVCFLFVKSTLAVMFLLISSRIFSAVLLWTFCTRWGYFPPSMKDVRKNIASRLIIYGVKGHAGTVFQSLNYRFDIYIVAYFLSASQVGIYSVAVAFSEILWMVPDSLGIVISQRSASRCRAEASRITATATRLMLPVLAFGCIAWALLGSFVIPLFYGAAFASASGAMFWLLPGIWFLGLWKNLLNDICFRGYPLYKTYSSGVAVLVTIILDLLLIPKFGIAGAAMASSAAYATAALITLFLYISAAGVRFRELLLPRYEDIDWFKSSFNSMMRALKS